MSTIRELAAIIGEQAVAIDLGRRLLQEAVDGRQVAEARADKAEAELDNTRKRLTELQAFIDEQGQEAMRQMSNAACGFGEVTTCPDA
jgi:chromosome condensin MukBEF ATPase and DNA-binding subunit MukB